MKSPYHSPELIKAYCEATESLPGDLAEVGVYRGDSAILILQCTQHGMLYLYDTFRGIPVEMTGPQDQQKAGAFGDTSVELVKQKLIDHLDRVVFRIGIFPQTAVDEGPFRFVHVDCDQYASVKASLVWFAPRLVEGGVILSDDYLCPSTPGARAAVNEFVKESNGAFSVQKIASRGIISRVTTEATV